jgi:prepilin peptidase dependent protein B
MLDGRIRQRGFSLVELMIAMALGLGSLSVIASVIGYGIGTNAKLLANSRLSEEINAIGSLITRDVKRAGYNGDTTALVTDPTASPSAFAHSVVVSQHPDEVPNSCIVFAYDRNSNGVLDTAGTNENYGFRLRNGAVEIRMAGAGCTDVGWQNLTDTDMVSITGLNFNLTETTFNGVVSTQVDMFLQGELAADNNFSRQYTTGFLVRSYD